MASHELLMGLLGRTIRDKRLLALIGPASWVVWGRRLEAVAYPIRHHGFLARALAGQTDNRQCFAA